MQFTLRPEGLLERVALWLNLGPTPIVQGFFGMMGSRAVMAGVRLGVYAELARREATAEELAATLKLNPAGALRLLESLTALGLVRARSERWQLTRRARRWLDPDSSRYVGDFLLFNYSQWEWWSHLEEAIRTGRSQEIHGLAPDDPRWREYMLAMFQLARLAAPEVARHVPLRRDARRVLDLAGGHGWFAAELCRRHPGLSATVMDLPGSVRVGREIISAAGMADRVEHVEGNLLRDDLRGPYDAVLCFQIAHHLSPEQNAALLRRVAAALVPAGTLAILEFLMPEAGRLSNAAALLGLHYYLTSTASAYRLSDVRRWLSGAGLEFKKAFPIRRLPVQTLVIAVRR